MTTEQQPEQINLSEKESKQDKAERQPRARRLAYKSVLTAVVVVARSGAAIAVEIGNMALNEEIEGLEFLGMDVGELKEHFSDAHTEVDAIIGAAASGISLSVIDKITGSQIPQCSPSNTAATFTDYDDNGLYFRTAPSDVVHGAALAVLGRTGGADLLLDSFGRPFADQKIMIAADIGDDGFVHLVASHSQ